MTAVSVSDLEMTYRVPVREAGLAAAFRDSAAAGPGALPGPADAGGARLAAAIRFLLTYTLALSAFWTERAHAVVGFGSTLIFLLGGEAAPLQMLPPALHPWAGALPFRAMNGFPAELAAGLLSPAEAAAGFGWQAIWLLVFAALAAAVWRAGLRRYTAVGG